MLLQGQQTNLKSTQSLLRYRHSGFQNHDFSLKYCMIFLCCRLGTLVSAFDARRRRF